MTLNVVVTHNNMTTVLVTLQQQQYINCSSNKLSIEWKNILSVVYDI